MESIRFFRRKLGLTQTELARKIGCSLDTISRYETDKREPRASDLFKMANVFGCSVDELAKFEAAREVVEKNG